MKPQVYKDPRPAEYFDRFHERQRTKRPNWMYELVRLLLTPYLLFIYRARCIDSHNVPAEGPVIIAPNHFSFLDHFFVAVYVRRKVHFMAKSQLFKAPMQVVYHNGGVFPVRRGHGDTEAFKTAHAILGRDDVVVMYAEAGRSRTGELGKPRHGIGRLGARVGRRGRARRRSPAPSAHVTGSVFSSPRSPCSSARRSASSPWPSRRRSRRRRRPRSSSSACARCTAAARWRGPQGRVEEQPPRSPRQFPA